MIKVVLSNFKIFLTVLGFLGLPIYYAVSILFLCPFAEFLQYVTPVCDPSTNELVSSS
jgi:hypothetical protein